VYFLLRGILLFDKNGGYSDLGLIKVKERKKEEKKEEKS